MDLFLDFLQNQQLSEWLNKIRDKYGVELADEEIIHSVQQTSEFYNLNAQEKVWEEWISRIEYGIRAPVINQNQVHDVGITNRDYFDLVLAHEGARFALRNLSDYLFYQEEYCCCFMDGVCARLKEMDMLIITSVLDDAYNNQFGESAIHVLAFEEGASYASEHLEKTGNKPSFSNCMEHFGKLDLENEYLRDNYEIDILMPPVVYALLYGPPIPDDFLIDTVSLDPMNDEND